LIHVINVNKYTDNVDRHYYIPTFVYGIVSILSLEKKIVYYHNKSHLTMVWRSTIILNLLFSFMHRKKKYQSSCYGQYAYFSIDFKLKYFVYGWIRKKKMYSIKLAWKTKLLYLPLLLKIWYIIIEFVNLNNLRGISEKNKEVCGVLYERNTMILIEILSFNSVFFLLLFSRYIYHHEIKTS
jgi:hypothetical protein